MAGSSCFDFRAAFPRWRWDISRAVLRVLIFHIVLHGSLGAATFGWASQSTCRTAGEIGKTKRNGCWLANNRLSSFTSTHKAGEAFPTRWDFREEVLLNSSALGFVLHFFHARPCRVHKVPATRRSRKCMFQFAELIICTLFSPVLLFLRWSHELVPIVRLFLSPQPESLPTLYSAGEWSSSSSSTVDDKKTNWSNFV